MRPLAFLVRCCFTSALTTHMRPRRIFRLPAERLLLSLLFPFRF
jgi:hypothetical protein